MIVRREWPRPWTEKTHNRGGAVWNGALDLPDHAIALGRESVPEWLGTFKVIIRRVEWSWS